jgi:hypothetical protein
MYDGALETGGDGGCILSSWWSYPQSCESRDELK